MILYQSSFKVYWQQSAMICAENSSVFIFSALLSFHCCNGKYLLLETEDENGVNGEGGEFKFLNEPLDVEMGSLEADLTENESMNRRCPFCQPDVPGGLFSGGRPSGCHGEI